MERVGVKIKLFYCSIVLLLINNTICLSQILITGNPISLCSSAAGSGNYSISSISNATYTWTVPNGMVITNGQGTNSITTGWTASSIQNGIIGDLCVTVDSSGVISSSCITIDLNNTLPAMPSSIDGQAKICPGDTFFYSAGTVLNASSYNWNVPVGVSILSGATNDTVMVTATPAYTAAGNISIAAVNSCGSSAYRVRIISPNIVTAPTLITGQANGVCKQLGKIYTCPSVTRTTSYHWNITGAGAAIVGANNDTTLIVDFDSTVTTITVAVNAVNGCGNGAARSLTVTGKPAVAGPISGPTTVCTNATYLYSVATVNGAATYTWTVPGGAIVTAWQGTKIVTVKFGPVPANNLTVAVKTSNDCGIATARALNGISNILCPFGIEEFYTNAFNVFPNPTHNQLIIDLKNNFNKEFTTEILNVSGQIVFNSAEKNTLTNQLTIDTRNLSSGVYMLLLRSKNFAAQKRFIID